MFSINNTQLVVVTIRKTAWPFCYKVQAALKPSNTASSTVRGKTASPIFATWAFIPSVVDASNNQSKCLSDCRAKQLTIVSTSSQIIGSPFVMCWKKAVRSSAPKKRAKVTVSTFKRCSSPIHWSRTMAWIDSPGMLAPDKSLTWWPSCASFWAKLRFWLCINDYYYRFLWWY